MLRHEDAGFKANAHSAQGNRVNERVTNR